ncbi:MAG: response regulator [Candidatus Geothermincolia bacterium]
MGRVIAYVEDDRDMIDLVSMILEKHGYHIKGFSESADALDRIEALEPDLILLDIMMPASDGFEVYRELKSRKATRGIPIIVVSAMKRAIDQIEKEGRIAVEGCLTKPFSIGDLTRLVMSLLP